MRILGAILILLGAVALAYGLQYGGFSYEKTEQIAKVGPFEANAKTTETIPLPPWVGGGALGLGVILLLAGGRGKR